MKGLLEKFFKAGLLDVDGGTGDGGGAGAGAGGTQDGKQAGADGADTKDTTQAAAGGAGISADAAQTGADGKQGQDGITANGKQGGDHRLQPSGTTGNVDGGNNVPADTKAAGQQTNGGAAAVQMKPEDYGDFDLKDTAVNETLLAEFKNIAASANLPKETAQKFIDLQISSFKAVEEAHKKNIETWQAENAKNYGDNLQEKEAQAIKGLDRFDSDAKLKDLLTVTGLIYHPDVVRFLVAVDEHTAEKPLIMGESGVRTESIADILHPNLK